MRRHQKIYADIRDYAPTSENIRRHEKICADIRKYTPTSEIMRRHQKIYADLVGANFVGAYSVGAYHPAGACCSLTERISIEVDMRSREKEGRTVHMFVDKKQSPLFFYGVPESVKIGVLFRQPGSIEFESFEELRESSVEEVEGGYGYRWEGEEVLSGEEDHWLNSL